MKSTGPHAPKAMCLGVPHPAQQLRCGLALLLPMYLIYFDWPRLRALSMLLLPSTMMTLKVRRLRIGGKSLTPAQDSSFLILWPTGRSVKCVRPLFAFLVHSFLTPLICIRRDDRRPLDAFDEIR